MKNVNVIYQKDNYRIIEEQDFYYDIEDLKGDCYKPEFNKEEDLTELKASERAFEAMVQEKGVFIYALEVWNPRVDGGWEFEDTCGGFIGRYETKQHYIVEEFKLQIPCS